MSVSMLVVFLTIALASGNVSISTIYPLMFAFVGTVTLVVVLIGHVVGLDWGQKSADSGKIEKDWELKPSDSIANADDTVIENSLAPFMFIFLGIITIAYLAGFIVAIPFAVYFVLHSYGQQSHKYLFAMMAILLITSYLLFEVLANIPLSDGLIWRLIR